MKLLTWNVNRSSVRRFRRQAKAVAPRQADILALTEVGKKARIKAADILGEYGYEYIADSRQWLDNPDAPSSGVLLASTYPLEISPPQFDVPKFHRARLVLPSGNS